MTTTKKTRKIYPVTRLTEFLRLASASDRARCAEFAGTSVAYLYQVAGLHRKSPGLAIAWGIEQATTVINKETGGRLPIVTMQEIAQDAAEHDLLSRSEE